MDLAALKHLASVAQAIGGPRRIIIFGSSSLFGTLPQADKDYEMMRRTNDADFVLDPFDEATGRTVHDAIGADAEFASQFGYYADIVRPLVTENFPPGWESRLIPLADLAEVFCLEPHDMAVAKLMVGRPKDLAFLAELLKTARLSAGVLQGRLRATPMVEAMIVKTHARLAAVASEAGVTLP
jgi:hypothetical protein